MADSLNWCNIEIYAGTYLLELDGVYLLIYFKAIVCSSASSFKAILKVYMPRFWNASHSSEIQDADHDHNPSTTGRFVIRSYKVSSKKTTDDRKYGFNNITTVGNESEEAIVTANWR
jgi:hypothetical protein